MREARPARKRAGRVQLRSRGVVGGRPLRPAPEKVVAAQRRAECRSRIWIRGGVDERVAAGQGVDRKRVIYVGETAGSNRAVAGRGIEGRAAEEPKSVTEFVENDRYEVHLPGRRVFRAVVPVCGAVELCGD